jgi:transcriptional regulator with XRE-family HTH domain
VTLHYHRRLKLTNGRQLRAARVLLGWSQIKLAKTSKVAIGTIRRMESFDGKIQAYMSTLYKVQVALERGGIEFLNDERPGVRLKNKL